MEVVTLSDGVFRRHHVADDGTVELVETLAPTWLQRRSMRVVLAGWLLGFASMIAAAAVSPVLIIGWFVGMVVFWVGGQAWARAHEVHERLRSLKQDTRGWEVAPMLNGWQPATTEQLRAVEKTADEHGGVAFVRDGGTRTVEVLVRRRFRMRRLWVDRAGNRGLTAETAAAWRPLARHVRQLASRGERWLEIKTAEPPEGD